MLRILLFFIFMILVVAGIIWGTIFHPKDVQAGFVHCREQMPVLNVGQKLKIISYNVQYMAGKNNVFFYDLPGFDGPDERPDKEDITRTFNEVARIINDENPDIILLQEVDDGAKRTDHEDQLNRLLPLISSEYGCYSSTFYWKAKFVPHPRIMGAVGMKLVTISKYKMTSAIRYKLEQVRGNILIDQFKLKRALLETRFPVSGTDKRFSVINVHLEAFADGSDVMKKQITQLDSLLSQLDKEGVNWVAGGDFNLLPPDVAGILGEEYITRAGKENEINVLYDKYQVVPDRQNVLGVDHQKWFTHFPNNPKINSPNKTIDYIFVSNGFKFLNSKVRQHDTLKISDHLPVVVEISE